jgi:RHS repeat-associated protein
VKRRLSKWVGALLTPVLVLTTVVSPVIAADPSTLPAASTTTPTAQPISSAATPSGTFSEIQSLSPPTTTNTATASASTVSSSNGATASAPSVPSSGAASSSSPKTISNVDVSFSTSSVPKSPQEIEDDRTAYSKRYLNPDGTYSVKTYLEPIHYKDHDTGKWLPIDSTLVSHGDGTYHNAANSFDISLPSVANNGLISLSKDGDSISFQPTFAGAVQGKADKNKMKYTGVATDTDLSYDVLSNGLKESIALNSAKAPTTFDFQLNLKGLTYKQKSDGTGNFYQSGSSKPIFVMPKPFMVDANGEFSPAVSYQFQQDKAGNTVVEVVADPTWLQSANRAFPVVIDPSIDYDTGISDTFISQSHPDTNYNYQHNYVGGNSSSFGVARPLFWFYLPTLPTGSVVTSATLNVDNTAVYEPSQKPTIEVHRITSNWSGSSVTWNTQPSISSIVDGTYSATNTTAPSAWNIPITTTVKNWYNGIYANQGLELKYSDETQVIREMLATADTSDPTDHPSITVNYTMDGKGQEPFWTFDGPVNMTNMNLVLPVTDMAFPGRRMAVPLSRTYNCRSTSQGVFGYNWSSPLDIRLYALPGQTSRLVGSNGTTYVFNRNTSGGYDSPPGMYWTINVVSNTTATITTVDHIVYTFVNIPNTTGVYELHQVTDANNNTLTYNYNANNQVSSIQDGANHTITLTYNTSGLLSTATDPAGKQTSYSYDANQNLITVTRPDGKSIQYRYDGSHHLTASVSPAGRITYYDYQTDASDSTSYRVSAINPTNMVTNGNFEVDSDGNNIPDHFSFYDGYNTGNIDTTDWAPYGPTSFQINTSSSNSANYTIFLSDPIMVNPNTAYTLSGYMRGSQTSGTLTTVLSMYAYDVNGNNLGEVGRTAISGTFNFTRKSVKLDPASGTGLPTGIVTVRIRLAASNSGGSGTSWWDGVQLEEGALVNPTPFVSGTQYTYYPPSMLSAAYNGDGHKHQYTYNSDQNLIKFQKDPKGLNLTDSFSWTGDRETSHTDPRGNTWNYTNDANTGKLTNSADPNTNSESYTYDSNAQLIQHKLFNSGYENYTYDSSRDLLTSRNPYNTSVASTYDTYGNTTSVSNPVGSADNLIDNSSFEEGTQSDGATPVHFSYGGGQTGWWGLSTQQLVSGQNSLTIAAQGGTSQPNYSILLSDPVSIDPTQGYLLAGYLMATQSSGSQITVLSVYAYDANGTLLGEFDKMELDGASNWKRWRTSILPSDLPSNTASLRVKVGASNQSGYGNSYFDSVQLQKNIIDTSYNLLDNADFERGPSGATWPNDWTQSASGTDSWVTSPTYTGGHAASISNATGTTGFGPSNYWPYNSNTNYTLTAFVKTAGLSANVGEVKIDEYDSNKNMIGAVTSQLVGDTMDWTMLTATLPANGEVAGTVYIRPVLATGNATGTIYFDNVRLIEGKPATTNTQYGSTSSWVTTVTDPLGNQTQYQYDGSGNVTTTTDPLGNATGTTYDVLNRVLTETPSGNDVMVNYTYDNDGNVTGISTTDPAQTTTYNSIGVNYTPTGQVQSYTDPLGNQTVYYYTPGSNLQEDDSPTGNSVSFGYDTMDWLTNISLNGSDRYDIGYDNNGNMTSITDNAQKITWSAAHDKLNRMTSWSDGTHTISYTLDASGNITQKTLATGTTTTQTETATFNLLNQLKTLTDATGSTNRFLYNENGSLSIFQAGNGIIERIDYDNDGRITNVVNQTKNGTIINSFQLTYDKVGHITSITDNTGVTLNYTYTAKGQLATETLANGDTVTYSYDALGNRKQKQETTPSGTIVSTVNYTYNAANQLTQTGNTTYSYYVDGNEKSNGTETYVWDAAGRLTEVENASTGAAIALYQYDSLNRLVQETSNGKTTNFLYDGTSNHVLAEYDSSGTQNKYYTWGPNGLLAITVNGSTYYMVHNARGDIVALTDSNGNTVVTYSYDTWGNLVSDTDNSGIGLASLNPYRYAEYRYDDNVGLYYLMARWYDSTVGRFLSQDSERIIPNYVYAESNPVSFIDPSGKEIDFIESRFGYYEINTETGSRVFHRTVSALKVGNRVHYDENNGGSKGSRELPSKLKQKYSDSEFRFTRRGEKGADVKVTDTSKHPSEYEDSKWPEGYDYGDWKPNTKSGWNKFQKDVIKGKLPENTMIIPYDPATGEPIPDEDLALPKGVTPKIPLFDSFIP